MNYDDMMILVGDQEADEMEVAIAMQNALNSGVGWRMEGSFGRSMMAALKSGRAMLGKFGVRDYYGNYIPSRFEVKEGSFGSRSFVAEAMGEDYASQLEAL